MSTTTQALSFDDPQLLQQLAQASEADLDAAPFGVIGFDSDGHVRRYNRYEAQAARFSPEDVLGQHVFVELAPCMNNYLVAGRFEEARESGSSLDALIPYVLTFRMRPTRVRLRLLAGEGELQFIVVDRLSGAQS